MAAEMGDAVTLSCTVRASPGAAVQWYFGTGRNDTLDNSTDVDSWTVATEVAIVDTLLHYRSTQPCILAITTSRQ